MSQHSDEPQPGVSSDSFWEPGNYKRTARRIEDGYRLCDSLTSMITERAEIEKSYAKGLRGWSKKWSDLIEKGPEYGTMEAAWKGVLNESDRLCDVHLKIKDNLCNDVLTQVKNWQKDTYHKSMIQIKERKEMEDAFKKAQKPWCKLLAKVERARTEYHTACKQQRSAANQERNAAGDTSLSPDQRAATVKKMQERVSKSKEDAARWREKYEVALKEIDAYNSRYVEDMTAVFERCQTMEAQRLHFFKQLLFSVHKCLNISQDPILTQIYDEFYHTINNADHQKDLKWWSNNHGVNMAMAWPQFESPPVLDEEDTLSEEEKESCAGCCYRHIRLIPSKSRSIVEDARYAIPSFSLPSKSRRVGPEQHFYWATRVAPSVSSVSAGIDSGFVEYTEEFRDIAKGKSKESLPAGPITLINQRQVGEDLHSVQDVGVYTLKKNKELPASNSKQPPPGAGAKVPPSLALNNKEKPDKNDISAPIETSKTSALSSPQKTITNGTGPSSKSATAVSAPLSNSNSVTNSKDKESNPFEEEEWDEEGTETDGAVDPLTDNGEPGVPVRALYDYQGAESDELTFRQGDLFEKLEDEDEQGWCKGRKDGRVGLYPANYVEPVGH